MNKCHLWLQNGTKNQPSWCAFLIHS